MSTIEIYAKPKLMVMKKMIFGVLSLVLLSACGAPKEFEIHTQGIDSIRLGMTPADLPDMVEGLYDRIEVCTTSAYYDELYDETTPAYDTYNFMLGDERMFYAELSDQGKIGIIYITSAKLSYKGLHPGMKCSDALATDAKLMAFYTPGDCFYCCSFRFDEASNIFINFPLTDGGSFSEQGYDNAFAAALKASSVTDWYELEFKAEDFKPEATISEIQISSL